jgi:protein-disulfide isomerase
MKNPWVIIAVITVALIGGAVWYSSSVSESYDEGVVITPHIKGNPDSPVKLVEYSDFQCPACAQFFPIVDEIVEANKDTLSFEYRNFPLLRIHPFAEPAARAAEAAGQQGKFFEFHDLLFINQATWTASPNPSAFFVQYAEELGLDMDLFMRHQKSPLIRAHVRAQFAEAQELGFSGTPSFLLNGKPMNVSSFEAFEAEIQAAINPSVNFAPQNGSAATEGGMVDGMAVPAGEEETSVDSTGAAAPTEIPVEATPEVRFGI